MYERPPRDFIHVPNEIYKDYNEACEILPTSPHAAAVLTRRCLQHLLRALGFTQRNLANQIKALDQRLGSRNSLSCSTRELADTVRLIGNLAAHPTFVASSRKAITLEYEDADWCLEIIEELLDYFYERPAMFEARLMRLEGRLQSAGASLF